MVELAMRVVEFCQIGCLCHCLWQPAIDATFVESFWAPSWLWNVTKSSSTCNHWITLCATCATKFFARSTAWTIIKVFIIAGKSIIYIQHTIRNLSICNRHHNIPNSIFNWPSNNRRNLSFYKICYMKNTTNCNSV